MGVSIAFSSARPRPPAWPGQRALAAERNQHESAEHQHCYQSTESQNIEYCRAVPALPGIVVITVEHQLVHQSSDPAFRGFNETQPDLTRGVLNSVAILRDVPVRSQQHDGAGMGVLVVLLVPGVTEAERLGEGINLFLPAYQKMPTLFRPSAAIALHVSLFCFQRGL